MFKRLIEIVGEVGRGLEFLQQIALVWRHNPCSRAAVAEQIVRVTTQSLPTTAMAGFFVGGIMTVQFTLQVNQFGALGYLGGLSTSGTIREIGPLLIAFLLGGKVGAYTSAELGTMRVTDQIDAIRCLGADPIREIVLPRFLGIIFSSFFLLVAGLFMSILGGMLMGIGFANINMDEYLRHIPTMVTSFSIGSGLIKCFVFAIVLATVCTFKGYHASGGARGVGLAVVGTAVTTMVGIVIADWITSFIGDVLLQIYLGD